MIILFFSLLGLILGSFINVLVDRSHAKKDWLHGRSVCDHCGRTLQVIDLIPVLSWLMLGGRCRTCKGRLSSQYPLVELSSGFLFALSYSFWSYQLANSYEQAYFGLWLVALVLLIAMAVYDLKWMLLPDRFNYPLLLISVLSVAVLTQIGGVDALKDQTAGLLVAWGLFASLYYLSRGRWLGGGDVKLAASLGLWLGFPKVLAGLLVAFYSATLVVLPLMVLGVVKRKQPVPFGPFLILGMIAGQVYGQALIDWYLGWFILP